MKKNSSDIRYDILRALKSLKALGVSQGDRVAIVGFNSTRYLILDVSIGLLGAVSVPLYYTSPVNEINEILKDCGARIIFVGTPKLLKHSNAFEVENPIVSFCGDDMELQSDIMSWNEFLAKGMEFETD